MLLFLLLITLSFANGKVDPLLKLEGGKRFLAAEEQVEGQVIYRKVLIKLSGKGVDGEALLKSYGGIPILQKGDILLGRVKEDSIDFLAKDERVLFIEAVRKLKYNLDKVAVSTGLERLRGSGELKYQGQGVIVGIVDSGIDLNHPALKGRILYVYNVKNGNVCDKNEIESNKCSLRDEVGHGTHVSGIIAGNGEVPYGGNSPYIGIAPEAEIIMVSVGEEGISGEDVIKGIEFILQKAEELNRPVVINLSLGTDIGPHDGTDLFSQTLKKFIQEGVVIVKSAGNSADYNVHLSGKANTQEVDIPIEMFGTFALIDIWYPGDKALEVKVYTPCGPTSFVKPGAHLSFSNNCRYVEILSDEVNPLNGDREILIAILTRRQYLDYKWGLILKSSKEDAVNFHAWVIGAQFLNGDNRYSISSDSTLDELIVVGSFTSKIVNSYNSFARLDDISIFSGIGPTRECSNGCRERIKPDLVAPGDVVCSSYPLRAIIGREDILICGFRGYAPLSGTSMSAPVITGTVALMLSKNPNLTPSQIKNILISATYTDSFTGTSLPNNTWGYGKIDIAKALELTPEPNASNEPKPQNPAPEPPQEQEQSPENEVNTPGDNLLKPTASGGGGCSTSPYGLMITLLLLFVIRARKIL